MRHVDPQRHRVLFAIGIGLLVINVPLGWGMLAAGAALAVAWKEPRWLLWGTIGYGASWVVFGLGALVSGRTGIARAREIRRRRRRLAELLHLRRVRRTTRPAIEPVPPA
jgi:hypothetical protein